MSTATAVLMPHDTEAEESAVGAMLLAPHAVDDVLAIVGPSAFYSARLGQIVEVIEQMRYADQPIDIVTVQAALRDRGILEHVGGARRLVELQAGAPSTTHGAAYAAVIRDHADRREALRRLEDAERQLREGAMASDVLGALLSDEDRLRGSSWDPQDLEALWDHIDEGGQTLAPPVLGRRADGACLVAPGARTQLIAAPESAKSLFAVSLVTEAALMGRDSIYVDFESRAPRFMTRLTSHVDGMAARPHLAYIRPREPFTPANRWRVERLVRRRRPLLVVLDGMNALLAKQGRDANKATEVGDVMEQVVAPWESDDTCILIIDHITKDTERQTVGVKRAGGSIAKDGLVDASISLNVDDHPRIAKGSLGWVELRVEKDRDGELRGQCVDKKTFGLFTVRSTFEGRWEHRINPPDGGASLPPNPWRVR